MFIWYIISGFGIMYQDKSGNPAWNEARKIDKIMINTFQDKSGGISQTFYALNWRFWKGAGKFSTDFYERCPRGIRRISWDV
jgi:hypothetical protein